ncbi:MAG: hypothetical protein ABIK09_08510 [Pseudomonadota bacterium]
MRRTTIGLVLFTLILWSPVAQARGGVFFGLGLGGAVTQGDDYVQLESGYVQCSGKNDICADAVHTDGTGGLGVQFLVGYNFFGYASIEANISGNGNANSGGGTWEGAGHAAGLIRVYPAQFVPRADLRTRWWDPNVYFGAGYSWMGYHLEYHPEHEGRGWVGMNWQFGFGSDFYLTESVAIGADFRFILPQFETYYHSWDDNITFTPQKTPTALVFAPMVTVTFHFADPLPREAVKPIVK